MACWLRQRSCQSMASLIKDSLGFRCHVTRLPNTAHCSRVRTFCIADAKSEIELCGEWETNAPKLPLSRTNSMNLNAQASIISFGWAIQQRRPLFFYKYTFYSPASPIPTQSRKVNTAGAMRGARRRDVFADRRWDQGRNGRDSMRTWKNIN